MPEPISTNTDPAGKGAMPRDGYVLGISCWYHDAAACLMKGGRVLGAASEELFTRKKHDPGFPKNAVAFLLKREAIAIGDIAAVGFYEKPLLKFERILETHLNYAPRGLHSFARAMPVWIKEKFWMKENLKKELGWKGDVIFLPHHHSHAASAYYSSPFDRAAILTVDGVGEWSTATYGVGRGDNVTLLKEVRFPHSLGLLYSAFTHYLGFRVNSGEYKVMGLAPYGKPVYYDAIRDHLISWDDQGGFEINMDYFGFLDGETMINRRFTDLFGKPVRLSRDPLQPFHQDVAASIQRVLEDVLLTMAHHIHETSQERNLVMAGGVALNSVANTRIMKETPFEHVFVHPAAGDAGGAYGVAAHISHHLLGNQKRSVEPFIPYQGPSYNAQEIRAMLEIEEAVMEPLDPGKAAAFAARCIADGAVVGWFSGRTEWGPRALGNRSILADPRRPQMKEIVNAKIKYREGFRPFAPSVLEERASEYFDLNDSEFLTGHYMLCCPRVKKDNIPAVTHVDGTGRVQVVSKRLNPAYHRLIREFDKLTKVPVVLNTSFNLRGEPMVNSPCDAFLCFIRSEMDYLVFGEGVVLQKKKQTRQPDDWQAKIEPD